MARVTLPHVFDDGGADTASGQQVMDMFNAILAAVNGGIDTTNVSATAGLVATQFAAAVQQLLHATADLRPSAKSGAPAGWLVCDGSAVSRATYATLFAAIGTAFGTGDGSTTFNLPDLRGRVPIGAGTGGGLSARTLGQTGGEEKHTQTLAELFPHAHNISVGAAGSHAHQSQDGHAFLTDRSGGGGVYNLSGGTQMGNGGGGFTASVGDHAHGASADVQGGGQAFNVMQPFSVVNWLIKT